MTDLSQSPAASPDAPAPEGARDAAARVAAWADALAPELVTLRRDLHAHPEIGFAEHRTTALIVDRLDRAGLHGHVLRLGTGVSVDILPDTWRATDGLVGLRGDIDALPIADVKQVPYASTVPGLCHACGHDVHTTVLLGVGLVLARLREAGLLRRGVRLIFQPAEETVPGGAHQVIAEGILDEVTEAYALHCDPRTDVGSIGVRVGEITSACDKILVRLDGAGGHTSRPHLTSDLVGALASVATQAPLLLSRTLDPRGGVSLIWGRVHAGSAANAIPRTGELEGTVRAMSVAGWEAAETLLPGLIEQIVAPYGVDVHVELTHGVPPTLNHADGVARLTASADTVLGPGHVVSTEQSLGGEDFSWMLQRVPGAMARLGVRTPGQPAADIHRPTFDVDERCLPVGVKVLAGLAL